jgi:hypothetical protein
MSLFMWMNYSMIITLLVVDVLNLYMLNVDDWMWRLHVFNYVVELLHVNDGDIDGECMYAIMKVRMMVNLLLNMCIVCSLFMHHKSQDIYIQ